MNTIKITPAQTPRIKLGHSAYSGVNAPAFLHGKTKAVAEMMRRGFKRADARAAIDKALESNGGYHVYETRGKLIEIEHIRDDRYAESFEAAR